MSGYRCTNCATAGEADGGALIFIERPIAALFLAIGVAAIALRIRGILREQKLAKGGLGDA
ncbi:hypothetical protein I5535_20035 [Rhodobacteraceae bacterium F11138]|nr:hypothetical protein [Rhodobacteraceae bacterium F11138]